MVVNEVSLHLICKTRTKRRSRYESDAKLSSVLKNVSDHAIGPHYSARPKDVAKILTYLFRQRIYCALYLSRTLAHDWLVFIGSRQRTCFCCF